MKQKENFEGKIICHRHKNTLEGVPQGEIFALDNFEFRIFGVSYKLLEM